MWNKFLIPIPLRSLRVLLYSHFYRKNVVFTSVTVSDGAKELTKHSAVKLLHDLCDQFSSTNKKLIHSHYCYFIAGFCDLVYPRQKQESCQALETLQEGFGVVYFKVSCCWETAHNPQDCESAEIRNKIVHFCNRGFIICLFLSRQLASSWKGSYSSPGFHWNFVRSGYFFVLFAAVSAMWKSGLAEIQQDLLADFWFWYFYSKSQSHTYFEVSSSSVLPQSDFFGAISIWLILKFKYEANFRDAVVFLYHSMWNFLTLF